MLPLLYSIIEGILFGVVALNEFVFIKSLKGKEMQLAIVFPIINSILKNNYSNSHFGKLYSYAAMTNKIVMMITTFVFGWMLDANPFLFVYIYPVIGILGIFSLFLLSFAWNGLFAATMSLLWNIGSAYFFKDDDAGAYQSVHLSMVGIRALIAPLFGIWLYQYIGFSGVFALGVLLLILSIAVMFWSLRLDRLVVG